MGHFLNNLYGKLRDIVGPGDELVEKPPESVPPEQTADEAPKDTEQNGAPILIEGIDYYLEGNYMVMTAKYLIKRGYCCETGCRHCPYGFNRKSSPKQPPTGER